MNPLLDLFRIDVNVLIQVPIVEQLAEAVLDRLSASLVKRHQVANLNSYRRHGDLPARGRLGPAFPIVFCAPFRRSWSDANFRRVTSQLVHRTREDVRYHGKSYRDRGSGRFLRRTCRARAGQPRSAARAPILLR